MFRFTIRDVLWLTVVVGLGVGWWADRWRSELTHDRDTQQLLQQESLLDSMEASLSVSNVDVDGLRAFLRDGRRNVKRLIELHEGPRPVVLPAAPPQQAVPLPYSAPAGSRGFSN